MWRLPALAFVTMLLLAAPGHAQSSLRYNQIQVRTSHIVMHAHAQARHSTLLFARSATLQFRLRHA